MSIRTLVAFNDHQEAARLIAALEDHDPDTAPIAWVPTSVASLAAVAELERVDVGVLDQAAGFAPLALLARKNAGTRWLVIGRKCSSQELLAAVRSGAMGWIEMNSAPRLLSRAVRVTHSGEHWFGRADLFNALRPQVAAIPVTAIPVAAPRESADLTPREREILHLIGEGLSNKEIGRRLDISDQTVKTHLHRVYTKLHRSGRYKAFLAQPRPITVRAAGPTQ